MGFWNKTVLPTLSPNCVVAVNVIGTQEETDRLQEVLRHAFVSRDDDDDDDDDAPPYEIISIAPPPEANVSARHTLVFAIPNHDVVVRGITARVLEGFVDVPMAWEKQIRIATSS